MGEGEAGGAANAASRGAARGRGASRCRMRRGAPFPLMSPPQKSASRASRCLKTAGGQDARPPLFVFAARRKPPPTSWSRAARAGGHSRPLSGGVLEGPGLSLRSGTVRCAAATGFSNDRSSSHFHFRSKQRNVRDVDAHHSRLMWGRRSTPSTTAEQPSGLAPPLLGDILNAPPIRGGFGCS